MKCPRFLQTACINFSASVNPVAAGRAVLHNSTTTTSSQHSLDVVCLTSDCYSNTALSCITRVLETNRLRQSQVKTHCYLPSFDLSFHWILKPPN